MSHTILRLPDVKVRTGLSRSTIYLGMGVGSFPKSVKVGRRAVGWIESEVDAWLEEHIQESRKGLLKLARNVQG